MPFYFISVFNEGSLELGRNHIQSLKNAGIENYIAYVTDRESYDVLKSENSNVVIVEDANVSNEKKDFGTDNFNTMSYLRYKIIYDHLKKGDDVWYLDTDTVVLHNLNKEYAAIKAKNTMASVESVDVYFQNDINMICTGCMLFFSNPKTANVAKFIYDNQNANENDQNLFMNLLQQNPEILSVKTLNTNNYPNGLVYFDDEFVSTPAMYKSIKNVFKNYRNKSVYFVHANWMVGNEKKKQALTKNGLWFLK